MHRPVGLDGSCWAEKPDFWRGMGMEGERNAGGRGPAGFFSVASVNERGCGGVRCHDPCHAGYGV